MEKMKLPTPSRKLELTDLFTTWIGNASVDFTDMRALLPQFDVSTDSAAQAIHEGIDYVFDKPGHEEARARMHECLTRIHTAFREGRYDEGYEMCPELHTLFSKTRGGRTE